MPGNFYESSVSPILAADSAFSSVDFSITDRMQTSSSMPPPSTTRMSASEATPPSPLPAATAPTISTVTVTVPCSTSSSVAPPPPPTATQTVLSASANSTTKAPVATTATPVPFTGGTAGMYRSVGTTTLFSAAAAVLLAMIPQISRGRVLCLGYIAALYIVTFIYFFRRYGIKSNIKWRCHWIVIKAGF
jgi:hypothetical protein